MKPIKDKINGEPYFDQRQAKLDATDDSKLSKAALWHKYHYIKGEILDRRAVLK